MLPRRQRISRSKELQEILAQKDYEAKSPLFYLALREQKGRGESRLVVVTSRKLGKAVQRNRLRRLYQTAFANIWRNIGKNVDVVLFPRAASRGLGEEAVREALYRALLPGREKGHD